MSKKQKLLERFTRHPSPKDFRWEELVTLMDRLGFDLVENEGGSSHKHFVSRKDNSMVINAARPHPSGILKHYQIQQIKDKLNEWNLLT